LLSELPIGQDGQLKLQAPTISMYMCIGAGSFWNNFAYSSSLCINYNG
jgi:hypothetical protein